jgi:hypothetical protein
MRKTRRHMPKRHVRKRLRRRDEVFERADFRRRLRLAGLGDDDAEAASDDEQRLALARRILMAINRWRGCPEPICRRNRGCMAPDAACGNLPDPAPMSREEEARGVARGLRLLRRAAERAERHADAAREDETAPPFDAATAAPQRRIAAPKSTPAGPPPRR